MNLAQLIAIPTNLQSAFMPLVVVVLVLQFFLIIFFGFGWGRLTKRYNAFMAGSPGAALEDVLTELARSSRQQDENLKASITPCVKWNKYTGIQFNTLA